MYVRNLDITYLHFGVCAVQCVSRRKVNIINNGVTLRYIPIEKESAFLQITLWTLNRDIHNRVFHRT